MSSKIRVTYQSQTHVIKFQKEILFNQVLNYIFGQDVIKNGGQIRRGTVVKALTKMPSGIEQIPFEKQKVDCSILYSNSIDVIKFRQSVFKISGKLRAKKFRFKALLKRIEKPINIQKIIRIQSYVRGFFVRSKYKN